MKFEMAELELVRLNANDVVATSGCEDPTGEGLE